MGNVVTFPRSRQTPPRVSRECDDDEALYNYAVWMLRATREVRKVIPAGRYVCIVAGLERRYDWEIRGFVLRSNPRLWRASVENMEYYNVLAWFVLRCFAP